MPRIIRQHAFGGPENLRLDDLASAEPGPGEARLRVEAVGLTRDQLPFLAGADYGGGANPELPTRFGYEAAGVVDAVGEGVDVGWVGKRVAPVGPFDQVRYGCAGEEGIVPAELLVEIPDSLSAAQAAALWVPYLTAYGVILKGQVQPGDHVVLTAGNSAVSVAAIQIVRDAGALPVAVVRSSRQRDRLRELGAHEVIVTGEEDYAARITEITGGLGPQVTFDAIGGDFLATLCQAAAPGGIVIEYGILGGIDGRFPVEYVLGKDLTIRGYSVGEISLNPELRATAAAYVLERVTQGRFTPRVAQTFALDEVQDAYAYVQAGPDLGRTVLVTGVTR
ncbi:MAG: zinc-dependent alcohol dehydrogenase family protein [Propionibacteriaceae bacterium]|nr:zinc-dependent alcohol dehydrogenase family protein [Actinomycetota bacterium]MCW5951182.1 zinc-dependent alcohol dehydrogenase family protein [Propionibacteriaceae bacterium]